MSEKYDWRYENSITQNKKYIDLNTIQEHKYSQWRTNVNLSNFHDTIHYANEMNINYHLWDKAHYDFLFHSIRKAKRWFPPETKEVKKLREKEQELFDLIQGYYKYNNARTKEALKLLTQDQIDIIRKKQEKGGVK
jgi:hypothetical protein